MHSTKNYNPMRTSSTTNLTADLPTFNDSDGSYSDDSYHNTHDGYSIPKKASFYTSICSDQNPPVKNLST